MKNIFAIFSSLLLILILAACQPSVQINPTQGSSTQPGVSDLLPKPGEKSMKGFELYSWQENGDWVYSLLVGTNREKTVAEIQAQEARLKNLDALKKILESIPAEEQISWVQRTPFSLPPEAVLVSVEKICQKQGLRLTVAR